MRTKFYFIYKNTELLYRSGDLEELYKFTASDIINNVAYNRNKTLENFRKGIQDFIRGESQCLISIFEFLVKNDTVYRLYSIQT